MRRRNVNGAVRNIIGFVRSYKMLNDIVHAYRTGKVFLQDEVVQIPMTMYALITLLSMYAWKILLKYLKILDIVIYRYDSENNFISIIKIIM